MKITFDTVENHSILSTVDCGKTSVNQNMSVNFAFAPLLAKESNQALLGCNSDLEVKEHVTTLAAVGESKSGKSKQFGKILKLPLD